MELNVLAGNIESKHATRTAEQETVMAAPRWGGAGKLSVALFVVLFYRRSFFDAQLRNGLNAGEENAHRMCRRGQILQRLGRSTNQ